MRAMHIRKSIRLLGVAATAAILLPACSSGGRGGGGGGDGDTPTDTDGDGLNDDFEDRIGTDFENPDTDGDGFSDSEEHLNYFFADDETDFPYFGEYPRGPIPRSVDGDGWSLGDVSDNWTGVDQYGEELQLHRFYGNVVVVELAADW